MENLPDFKQLKKLADACRKAGIKTFKGFGMEFTLSEENPSAKVKRAKAKKPEAPVEQPFQSETDLKFESDSLSEEALLFWSSSPGGQNIEAPPRD